MVSSLRAGSLIDSPGNGVALLPVTSTHSTPSLPSTVQSNLGGSLKAKAVFLPLPLSSLLPVFARAICVRGRIHAHQTLTTPQAGMSQEGCSRLNRFPSAFSRGLGSALASLSINMVTWTATLLLAPPFHTLTTRPFPAPSRVGSSLQGTQGNRGPWALAPEDPHPLQQVYALKVASSRSPAAPVLPGARLPRHSRLLRHIFHVSLSEDRGSTERKHGSWAGSGFFPWTIQAWRTMEQLSGFLHGEALFFPSRQLAFH